MRKGACSSEGRVLQRSTERRLQSDFISATALIYQKCPAFLGESLLRSCGSLPLPFLTLPLIQEEKKNKRQERKSNRKTGQLSILKCRKTLRNKVRSYGTTERTIFFLLLISLQWPPLKKQPPKPSDASLEKDKIYFQDICYIREHMAGAMATQFLSHEQCASKILPLSSHRKFTQEVQQGPAGPGCP